MSRHSILPLVCLAFIPLSCDQGGFRMGHDGGDTASPHGAVFLGGSISTPGAVRGDDTDLPEEPSAGKAWVQKVPGTAIDLVMRPVPDAPGGALWVMEHELTWNLFDIFIFRLDEKKGGSTPATDAVTRPTKPYIAVDRGFGHDDYPAISMSHKGAMQFAEWMRAKTGRNFQIPTVEQWSMIAASAGIPADAVEDYGWDAKNSDETTHPIGQKKSDALGLKDLYGNVAEWCTAKNDKGEPTGVVMGGGYESPAKELNPTSTVERTFMWNDSDPQFPKSVWWLADAAFVGLRLVCLDGTPEQTTSEEKTNDQE
jgi:hypothetical protein